VIDRLFGRRRLMALLFALGATSGMAAPPAPPAASQAASPEQQEANEYTRYELLDPASARFHILYEVSATTPGATTFFNPIRKGSEASDEAVFDRMTGKPLRFEVVGGAEARAGGVKDATDDARFIKVWLARPVPADGEARLLIEKTYRDAKSYFSEGDRIVFARPLGIKRNAVVLPAGYELLACNVPAQVLSEKDGRIAVSFINVNPDEAPLVLKARRRAR
jgi:hypothetical protein